jgi:uncharacterized protein YbcC (UPF0753/DUF2309 family)
MNMHVSQASLGATKPAFGLDQASIVTAAKAASRRIAPLWPLKNFVAVNPYLGLADLSQPEAAAMLAKIGGCKLVRPLSFYAQAIASGCITEMDLDAALAEYVPNSELPGSVAAFRTAIASSAEAEFPVLPTIADTAQQLNGKAWPLFVAERITHWASNHFDDGRALWKSPARGNSLHASWRAQALFDMTPDLMGLRQFRTAVRELPATAPETIVACVNVLGLEQEGLVDYFHRLLFTLGGWASYARYLGWDKELDGEFDSGMLDLLAIRLAWEHGLLSSFRACNILRIWKGEMAAASARHSGRQAKSFIHLNLAAHLAYERSRQRKLFSRLPAVKSPGIRPRVQAVFCIDVRSEIFRRALESVSPEIETLGFAGFFGASISYAPIGQDEVRAQVPVLLKPAFAVREKAADGLGTRRLAEEMDLKSASSAGWKAFQHQAVSSFGFVEAAGTGFALKLLKDAMPLNKMFSGTSPGSRTLPSANGIPKEARCAMAENALRGMSLTKGFARLVLLIGHGSSSINNPHASGLDCGACGGHTGEVNARIMAAILNDPDVRTELGERGIEIPPETHFQAALHNTTTDEVALLDADLTPALASRDADWFRDCLSKAGIAARSERAARLPGASDPKSRAKDWSQVRPEWGLAGCAAFIAAPRSLTKSANFEGRAFLHSYDWKDDRGFKILELIMTAPMVVASWISLQYFASTIDNQNFGSGNKVLHNVVGTFGVLEGNSGVLRTGLPLQSVHDGERFVHDPLRLSVVIAAPEDAMNAVIARHNHVRDLLENGWLHLVAMDDNGRLSKRYAGNLTWAAVEWPAKAAA